MSHDSPIDPHTLEPGTCIAYEYGGQESVRYDPSGIFLGFMHDDPGAIEIGWDDGTALDFRLHRLRILQAWHDPTAMERHRHPGAWGFKRPRWLPSHPGDTPPWSAHTGGAGTSDGGGDDITSANAE